MTTRSAIPLSSMTADATTSPFSTTESNDAEGLDGSGSDHMPFRFFDLSREMRNRIYALFTMDWSIFRPSLPPHPGDPQRRILEIEAEDFGVPALRLVGRQFKNEYEDEILRKAVIAVNLDYPNEAQSDASLSWSLGGELGTLIGSVAGKIRNLTVWMNASAERERCECESPPISS
jgi:hypothetical protein